MTDSNKDALVRTRAAVIPMIVETTGAGWRWSAPHSRRHVARRLSQAAVMYDARGLRAGHSQAGHMLEGGDGSARRGMERRGLSLPRA